MSATCPTHPFFLFYRYNYIYINVQLLNSLLRNLSLQNIISFRLDQNILRRPVLKHPQSLFSY
jgi:hypothetical protein